MPRRNSREALLRDLRAVEEVWNSVCDADGTPVQIEIDPRLARPWAQLSTRQLRQLASSLGAKPQPVGRPRHQAAEFVFVADIEFLMRLRGRGLLDACRRHYREYVVSELPIAPGHSQVERAAAALAKRYNRARKKQRTR